MDNPYLGSVMPVAFNFAPRGWMSCEGQTLPINQNTALFSLLGTSFGGNGQTTFCLPDLRGRAIVGQGAGPGMSSYVFGQMGGSETVSLTLNNLAAHNHPVVVNANQIEQESNDPQNNYFGGGAPGNVYTSTAPDVQMNPAGFTCASTGGGQPLAILSPYLTNYYIIAISGIFPTRG